MGPPAYAAPITKLDDKGRTLYPVAKDPDAFLKIFNAHHRCKMLYSDINIDAPAGRLKSDLVFEAYVSKKANKVVMNLKNKFPQKDLMGKAIDGPLHVLTPMGALGKFNRPVPVGNMNDTGICGPRGIIANAKCQMSLSNVCYAVDEQGDFGDENTVMSQFFVKAKRLESFIAEKLYAHDKCALGVKTPSNAEQLAAYTADLAAKTLASENKINEEHLLAKAKQLGVPLKEVQLEAEDRLALQEVYAAAQVVIKRDMFMSKSNGFVKQNGDEGETYSLNHKLIRYPSGKELVELHAGYKDKSFLAPTADLQDAFEKLANKDNLTRPLTGEEEAVLRVDPNKRFPALLVMCDPPVYTIRTLAEMEAWIEANPDKDPKLMSPWKEVPFAERKYRAYGPQDIMAFVYTPKVYCIPPQYGVTPRITHMIWRGRKGSLRETTTFPEWTLAPPWTYDPFATDDFQGVEVPAPVY